MTYLAFHLVFLLPPLAALAWLYRRGHRPPHARAGLYLWLLAAIALVYTTPWDNYLVARGVWGYGADRVVATIGYVPVEEYLFFLLQPLLAGLWLYVVLGRDAVPAGGARPEEPAPTVERARAAELARPAEPARDSTAAVRVTGTALYLGLAAAGALLLLGAAGEDESGTYLGLILVWAAPVLAAQWAYAGPGIWRRRRAWLAAVAIPTVYLWFADAVAISLGIWHISPAHTLGVVFGPLPLEEAVFFLATNLLVVQGLLLFLYPRDAP